MPTITSALALAISAHDRQMTKGGDPYWTHLVAVMQLLPADASDDLKIAALLHDIIEDTPITSDDLRAEGYSERTIDLVETVTRPEGDDRATYIEWIQQIIDTGDRDAITLKLADNRHNMMPERIAKLPEEERGILRRYQKSSGLLEAALTS